MSELQSEFQRSTEEVKQLPDQSNDNLLKLYSLFKQATTGDVQGKRPGFLDIRGRAKFDACAEQKGKSKEAAMQEYVEFVKGLQSS